VRIFRPIVLALSVAATGCGSSTQPTPVGGSEPPATSVVVYDLVSDWSDQSNPAGTWTYREGVNALPHVDDWRPLLINVAQPAWSRQDTNSNYLPTWFKSTTDNPSGFDFRAGDVVVHSTDTFRGPMGDANVLWTSPIGGVADVSGSIWMVRDIGRGNTWRLSHNGSVLTSGHVSSGDPYSRAQPFQFSSGSGGVSAVSAIQIGVGDQLRLDVLADNRASGGDFVGLTLTLRVTQ